MSTTTVYDTSSPLTTAPPAMPPSPRCRLPNAALFPAFSSSAAPTSTTPQPPSIQPHLKHARHGPLLFPRPRYHGALQFLQRRRPERLPPVQAPRSPPSRHRFPTPPRPHPCPALDHLVGLASGISVSTPITRIMNASPSTRSRSSFTNLDQLPPPAMPPITPAPACSPTSPPARLLPVPTRSLCLLYLPLPRHHLPRIRHDLPYHPRLAPPDLLHVRLLLAYLLPCTSPSPFIPNTRHRSVTATISPAGTSSSQLKLCHNGLPSFIIY